MKVAAGVVAAGVVVAVALIRSQRTPKAEAAATPRALEPATGEHAATT
jgi:hypothetical protein